ncbi:hypothetical protein BG006_009156 [Podila minutissima]|uniref:RING-type domain-containing protein n=1 Tax=Podila minutissima TaxID=64525 RepID=A0A9P5SET6_9FUNG|nr:hypothetical protein BG006_009156 [Podila minutissima]
MSDKGSKRSSRRNSDADTETESESGESHRDQDHRGGGGSHSTGSGSGSREHFRSASADSARKSSARDPFTSISSSSTSKRPKRNPSVKCPICRENVAPGQYQQHYRMELAQLEAGASADLTRGKRGAAIAATKHFNKGKSRGSTSDEEKRTIRDIQKRRTARQNNKDAGSGSGSGSGRPSDLDLGLVRGLDGLGEDSPATCFICNERLFGSLEDINNHIDACLTNPQPAHPHRHSGHGSSGHNTPSGSMSSMTPNNSHNNNRVDSFEEYTWAGQTRVRATALFEGGMGALGSGSGSGSRSVQTDIDDDLNVEDDEEEEYGGAQFTERDIVMDDGDDPDADELREIVMASSSAVQRKRLLKKGMKAKKRVRPDRDVDIMDEGDDPGDVDEEEVDEDAEIDLEGDGQEEEEEEEEEEEDEEEDEEENVDAQLGAAFASGDTRLVIDALRAKIKHLESANRNVPSCLICLDPYTVPLTSIVCWHVHCEACWMKTLGSKKLCPQCQKITLPKDLRRIYL